MLDLNAAPKFYHGYLGRIQNGTALQNLMESGDELSDLVSTIPEEKGSFAYAEGKWTVKEVLQHLNDAERIFCYRALRFARNDQTELAGFDQDAYVPESRANDRKLSSILNEFHILRAATIDLFANFDQVQMKRMGRTTAGEFSVEAIGYIMSGHCLHHLHILEERYLNAH